MEIQIFKRKQIYFDSFHTDCGLIAGHVRMLLENVYMDEQTEAPTPVKRIDPPTIVKLQQGTYIQLIHILTPITLF